MPDDVPEVDSSVHTPAREEVSHHLHRVLLMATHRLFIFAALWSRLLAVARTALGLDWLLLADASLLATLLLRQTLECLYRERRH